MVSLQKLSLAELNSIPIKVRAFMLLPVYVTSNKELARLKKAEARRTFHILILKFRFQKSIF